MRSQPRGAPFSVPFHRGGLGGHGAGDARFAPHTWERTLARCVIGKHGLRLGPGPLSCAPGSSGSRCTQEVEVSLHLSLFI